MPKPKSTDEICIENVDAIDFGVFDLCTVRIPQTKLLE